MLTAPMKETFAIFGFVVATILAVIIVLRVGIYLFEKLFLDLSSSEILDDESYPHALRGPAAFVADHIIASFKEGMVVAKHGTLGKALVHHWHHAAKYHPEKVKWLDSKSLHFLERDPAVFYLTVGCREHFIEILMHLK